MKEFVEKLIDRLEEEIQDVSESQSSYEVGSDMSITCSHIMGTLRDVKNRIIPKLAEEYKTRVIVDNEYCWQKCSAVEHCKECNRLGNGITDYFENYDSLAEEYNNGWIPCSERLPEHNQIVMCSAKKEYANYRIILERFDDKEYWHNGIIEAWQPLPQPYHKQEELQQQPEWKDSVMKHFTKVE